MNEAPAPGAAGLADDAARVQVARHLRRKKIDVDDSLLSRRDQLKLRSDYLRNQLSFKAGRVQPVFRAADRVADGAQWVKAHPGLVAVAVAGLLGAVIARPRAFMRLGSRAFAAWQMVQRTQPLVRAFMRRG
ncbi:YqjK family protein [Ottowia oryzae]